MTPDSLAPQRTGFHDFRGLEVISTVFTRQDRRFVFGGEHANLRQMGLKLSILGRFCDFDSNFGPFFVLCW